MGSLRDLVIYPHSQAQMEALGRTDAMLYEVLKWGHCSPEVLGNQDKADLQFTIEGKVSTCASPPCRAADHYEYPPP